MKNLTARTVAALKPGTQQYDVWDTSLRGFGVRVAPSGRVSFAIRYTLHRRLRRMHIGDAEKLSLADARETARTALREVELGRDPAQQRAERRDAEMFDELADRYIDDYAKARKRSWKNDERLLAREVVPQWKHRPARDIRRRDVRELVDAVAASGRPILANRLRAMLHKLFAFAVATDVLEANPVTGTERPGIERQRDRVLNHDEIRLLWAALDAEPLEMAAVYKLRLITAQRGGEVVNMRWADVDLTSGWWTIPAEHAKNGLPHRVPLSVAALDILRKLREQAESAILVRAERTGKPVSEPIFVLAGARGKRQRGSVAKEFKLENFRGHDLRRTAASYMASAGVQRLVISKILNHVERGVTAVYDRHSYDAEKRAALDLWARTLTAIIENEDAKKDGTTNNVVQFARG